MSDPLSYEIHALWMICHKNDFNRLLFIKIDIITITSPNIMKFLPFQVRKKKWKIMTLSNTFFVRLYVLCLSDTLRFCPNVCPTILCFPTLKLVFCLLFCFITIQLVYTMTKLQHLTIISRSQKLIFMAIWRLCSELIEK